MSARINCSSGVTKAKNVSGCDLVDLSDPPAFSFRVAAGNTTPALATLLLTGTVRFLRERKKRRGALDGIRSTPPIRLDFVAEFRPSAALSRARLAGISFFYNFCFYVSHANTLVYRLAKRKHTWSKPKEFPARVCEQLLPPVAGVGSVLRSLFLKLPHW
jgi:hypothetical protein